MSDDDPKARLEERFAEVGLSTERFIVVKDGEKKSVDHEQHRPDAVSGNYGVYANGHDALCILDVDDYEDLDDKSGISALHQLPPTLEQGSPHGGTHQLYKVEPTSDGRLVAAALKDAFGTANPAPSWGEVQVKNKYVVGAGSQLDDCGKCDSCQEPDQGYYVLQADREIATIDAEELIDVLADDPSMSRESADASASESHATTPSPPDDVDDRLEYARENDDKLDRLMRGDYSDYGGDRSKAEYVLAFKLAFWLGGDKHAVRQAIEHDARTEKWDERTDDSYRESVLSAVDEQNEFYEPGSESTDASYAPDVDWDEVDRGQAILEAERGITDPYGDLTHRDGHYGYLLEHEDEHGNPTFEFRSVTNFSLSLEHVIETYEGKLLTIKVHPSSPMEDPYTVQVHPTVFNSPTTFSEEIVRGRTTYLNPVKGATKTLNDLRLTVGHQTAPEHTGTEYIGLHGNEYGEWVTPAGTLTAEGWSEKPTHKYYEKGGEEEMESSLEDKWGLSPDGGSDYDADAVNDILTRVPDVRMPDRGLPILGWFYAAPLKPIIHDIEGEFNLLQVTGDTEAGKTSTLQLFYELFGADPAPFGCGDTNFTIEKKFAGSCGLPIWLDEYKPTDLSERKLNWLHRRLREVTREKSVSKGQQDLGEITFKMRAPVVFSGEQTVTEAAVRRRTVLTHLTDQATTGRQQEAFSQLVGASYTDADGNEQYPAGYDLSNHALAFYEWLLEQSPEDLETAWRTARETTREHLKALNVGDLDGSELQGLQTVVFGVDIFRAFAEEFDVDRSALPDKTAVRSALAHIVSNIGPDGRRKEHIDEFVELMAQAASAGYLENQVHHRVFNPEMADDEALAFHMPTTFSEVKKYAREYNVEDEHSLLGKTDYLDSFRDKADSGESYPLAVNHRVRGIENGSKAVVIDPHRAAAILPDGFNLSAFVDADDEAVAGDGRGDDDDGGPMALADLEPGYQTVEAEVASVVEPKPWLEAEATVDDGTAKVDLVARGEEAPDLEEGVTYHFEDIKVDRDQDDVLVLEYRDGATEASAVEDSGTQSGLESHSGEAAADGGSADVNVSNEEFDDTIKQWVTAKNDGAGADFRAVVSAVADDLDIAPQRVEDRIKELRTKGDVYEAQTDKLRTV
jgi:hypothetical protein